MFWARRQRCTPRRLQFFGQATLLGPASHSSVEPPAFITVWGLCGLASGLPKHHLGAFGLICGLQSGWSPRGLFLDQHCLAIN